MPETWRSAFLKQAWSDYQTYLLLNEASAEACHQLHYLQMASEKLARAFRTGLVGMERPTESHSGFVRFIQTRRSRHELRDRYTRDNETWLAYLRSLLPLAQRLQDLAPAIAGNGPNPEYPWETGGLIHAPSTFAFPLVHPATTGMRKLLLFLAQCFQEYGPSEG